MRNNMIFSFLLFTLFGCSNSTINEAVDNQNLSHIDITTKQSELISEVITNFPNKTEMAIAFINNSDASFYGIKRTDDEIINVNNSHGIFEIGSITKVFTSTLLANLVIEKRIDLDDKINDVLLFDLKDRVSISYLELANHTSGLPRVPSDMELFSSRNPENPYRYYNRNRLKKYLRDKVILLHTPGSGYEYSNLGAGLLGYTLCKLENKSYGTLLDEKIFSKYDMRYTSIDHSKFKDYLVEGLDINGNITSNWDLASFEAAGAILSNVEDLSKFGIAQFDISNEELILTRKMTFSIKGNLDVGLGWHIIKTDSGDLWHWHNGGTGGYSSSMAIDMENKTGIVILSNISAFHRERAKIDDLCFELMKNLNEVL